MKSHPAPVLDAQEPVSKAFDALAKSPAVIIMKDGEFVGIIDDRNARFGLADTSKTKCETVFIRTPALSANSTVFEACQSFLAGHFKALPVMNNGRVSEVVTRTDLLARMITDRMIPRTSVKELMNVPIYTIDHKETLANAKTQMRERQVRKLIATRNEIPFGIISTHDLVGLVSTPKGKRDNLHSEPTNLEHLAVSEFIRETLTTIDIAKALEDASQLMVKERVSSILITEGGKPKGVLSATDVFKQAVMLANEKPPFPISGLDASEKEMYESEMRSEISPIIEKFGKSLEVSHVSLHSKKNKNIVESKLFFELDGKPVSVEGEAHTHRESAAQVAHELHVILAKQKDKKAHKQIHNEEE